MTGVKIRDSERWKHRRKPTPVDDAAPAPIETRIDRWVAHQIVDWPSSHCFGCRKPIVADQKWVELVHDDNRARFRCDCEPVWRAEQEALGRKTLWGQVQGAQNERQ
jgi:hypothetical protein